MPEFLRRVLYLVIFACVAVPTCSGLPAADLVDPVQVAQEMREGCVGSNLTLLLGMADYFAPMCEARDLLELEAMLAGPDCSWTSGIYHDVICSGMQVGTESLVLSAELIFIGADGFPVEDPGQSEMLLVRFDSASLTTWSEGELMCTSDPVRGLVLSGTVTTRLTDGCEVRSSFDNVTARRVADLPGGGSLLFSSGNAQLETIQPYTVGTAALVGRKAVIALDVAGTVSHGEIDLVP